MERDKIEEFFKKLYRTTEWHSTTVERLEYKEYSAAEDVDENLDTLIALFVNKKSRRVRYAGTKLRKVFPELPPVEQRKVGLALLTGSKVDTEWVCKRLFYHKPSWDKDWTTFWHPVYADSVQEAWNKYQGTCCAKVIIQFLDKEVIRKHIDKFLNINELYFMLCRRLVNEPWFKLEVNRLAQCTTISNYLSILSQTKAGIGDEEAERLLYQWIGALVAEFRKKKDISYRDFPFFKFNYNRLGETRVICAWGFDAALYYMLKMGKKRIVADFLQWDKEIYDEYYADPMRQERENFSEFIHIVLERFPQQYKYLCYPNERFYLYTTFNGAFPYTKPRPISWYGFKNDKDHDILRSLLDNLKHKLYLDPDEWDSGNISEGTPQDASEEESGLDYSVCPF